MAEGKLPVVLVHGGMHGGWCWKRMRPLLTAAGHEVFTPTLTGLGERAHLGGPEITLSDHVRDVLEMVRAEELERFVLVGHSYGGLVITGVAEALGSERIAELVYLDAIVPFDGECGADVNGRQFDARTLPDGMIRSGGYHFGLTDPEDIAWVERRITPHSARTLLEPVRIESDHSRLSRTFIECTAHREGTTMVDGIARRALEIAQDPSWRHLRLDAGHDCMISHPRQTADLILDIAARAGNRA